MILCAKCNKVPAPIHKEYGPMWCESCNSKKEPWRPAKYWSVPDRIKNDAAKHWSETLQPRRQGEPSKEFIKEYPRQAKEIFTKKEIRSAKNTWYEEPGAKSSKHD